MRKNQASQVVVCEMISATDGSAFTGTVTVYVTGDAGTQTLGTVGSGVCTNEGNGCFSYAPSQAETNYNHIAFTFIGTGAVPATVQIYTESIDRHDTAALGLSRLDAAISSRMASYTQPTGFLAATFPSGTVANTTNITAGTITTCTNLTNAATSGDLTATMKASVNTEVDTAIADVGLTTTITGRIDAAITTRMASYTQPSGFLAATFPTTLASTTNITAGTISSLGTGAIVAATFAANAITASALAADAGAELADAVWDEALAGHAGAGSAGAALGSGGAGLTQADVRTAIGLATANLDTQLDALPTAVENADALLKRDWTAVTGEAARSVLNALRAIRNKWSLSSQTHTVTKEDDTTTAWTATITSNSNAEKITSSDPN